MRKLLLLIIPLFLLVACSGNNDKEQKVKSKNKNTEETVVAESKGNQPDEIFSYEYGSDDRFEVRTIDSSLTGNTIIFNTKEEIKRKGKDADYIKYEDQDVVQLRELSEHFEEGLEDSICTKTHISPNGKYVTYSCLRDDPWFVVFDTEKGENIHFEKELKDEYFDLIGITDHMEFILVGSYDEQLAIHNPNTKETIEYDLTKIVKSDEERIDEIIPVVGENKVILPTAFRIYVFDLQTEEVDVIVDVAPYEERFKEDTDEIVIGGLNVSPNGKYLFYRLEDTTRNDVYKSYNFHNVETGEKHSHSDWEYVQKGPISNNGLGVLKGNEHIYFFDINDGTMYLLPMIEAGVYVDNLTITGDGKTLFFTDREGEGDTDVTSLYQLSIDDYKQYETAEVNGTKEDTEALLAEQTTKEKGESLTMYSINDDPKKLFKDTWLMSEDVPYPTKYPEKVARTTNHFSFDRFSQKIYLDNNSIYKRKEIEYRAVTYPDSDRSNFCIDKDLELEKTENGVDYYFYLFDNEEVELAFEKEGWCYVLEGKGFTKEEMFTMIDSLKRQGKTPEKLPLDKVKFPTELPIENPEISHIHFNDYGDRDYFVDYKNDKNNLKIRYEVMTSEPSGFASSKAEKIKWEEPYEAYYRDKHFKLSMYDGEFYYHIQAKIKDEQVKQLGGKEVIKEALLDIAKSLE